MGRRGKWGDISINPGRVNQASMGRLFAPVGLCPPQQLGFSSLPALFSSSLALFPTIYPPRPAHLPNRGSIVKVHCRPSIDRCIYCPLLKKKRVLLADATRFSSRNHSISPARNTFGHGISNPSPAFFPARYSSPEPQPFFTSSSCYFTTMKVVCCSVHTEDF